MVRGVVVRCGLVGWWCEELTWRPLCAVLMPTLAPPPRPLLAAIVARLRAVGSTLRGVFSISATSSTTSSKYSTMRPITGRTSTGVVSGLANAVSASIERCRGADLGMWGVSEGELVKQRIG